MSELEYVRILNIMFEQLHWYRIYMTFLGCILRKCQSGITKNVQSLSYDIDLNSFRPVNIKIFWIHQKLLEIVIESTNLF